MSFGLSNLVVLFGLAAVLIPLIIHLLSRRRFEVVDWGAMQFLQVSKARKRRILFDELLLLALRMLLIAVLVLSLTAPFASGPVVAELAGRPNRSVVLVVDGSYSMGLDDGKNPVPRELARTWAQAFLDELVAGDTAAVVLAAEQPVVLAGMTRDLAKVQQALEQLPPARSSCDGPRAVGLALELLRADSTHNEQDLIVLSDGQKIGWLDPAHGPAWQSISAQINPAESAKQMPVPRLWFVDLLADRTLARPPANFMLTSTNPGAAQAWQGHPYLIKSTLVWTGQKADSPSGRMTLLVDGHPVQSLPMPKVTGDAGQTPINLSHRFSQTGSHVLSLLLEPDPPMNARPPGYQVCDVLPQDNRLDWAVQVGSQLPILLVDGDMALTPQSSTFFLRNAFVNAQQNGSTDPIAARTITLRDFDPQVLESTANGDQAAPRVLILADVPSLTVAQQDAIEKFLNAGGSVWVILGKRITEPKMYNNRLFRDGKGWFPVRLKQLAGDNTSPGKDASPDLQAIDHPVLAIFREQPGCTLGEARFPRWWKVETPPASKAITLAHLTTGDPMLLECPYGKGKVLVSTVPFDRSWDATFPRIWEYPVLVHRLVHHLGLGEVEQVNMLAGQPLVFQPPQNNGNATLPATVTVERPDHTRQIETVSAWPFIYENTHEPGIYQVSHNGQAPVYYVLHADRKESDLTPINDEEWTLWTALAPFKKVDTTTAVGRAVVDPNRTEDVWWLVMLIVIALLCCEIWLTRRMVIRRNLEPAR